MDEDEPTMEELQAEVETLRKLKTEQDAKYRLLDEKRSIVSQLSKSKFDKKHKFIGATLGAIEKTVTLDNVIKAGSSVVSVGASVGTSIYDYANAPDGTTRCEARSGKKQCLLADGHPGLHDVRTKAKRIHDAKLGVTYA